MRWHSDKRRDARYRQLDFDQFLAKPIDEVVLKALLMLEGEHLDRSLPHNGSVEPAARRLPAVQNLSAVPDRRTTRNDDYLI